MNPRIGFSSVVAAALIPGDRIIRPEGKSGATVSSVMRSLDTVTIVLHDSTSVVLHPSTRISLRA